MPDTGLALTCGAIDVINVDVQYIYTETSFFCGMVWNLLTT